MRGGSRINRQEQVKVVVRLRPEFSESRFARSVYLSSQDESQLVVETDSKKEIFMFDYIANELTSQQELHKMMGSECVQQIFEGYNCCIFAYGQTGAGKTYSVLGNHNDLQTDPYCPSRGLLPRVLEDIFEIMDRQQEGEKFTVTCSYIEIYNQQIFDLLSTDKRIHQIREDAKKGVFVEGLIQKNIFTYRSAVSILLEGQKTRKMASTLMNAESSRSHAIFTILLESQIADEQTITSKKAKLHIVDLAGSQRVKHTNVEGQRLREGCNINRSLHVLCNVINSLAESTKKKKHIPFRDSKLTHYLKDSLGGNSITKLLANIHTGKQYLGDTLSTLMFAKRAKSLKMKVELNETVAQNFDALRKEVRKLREELAQARYFKTEGRFSDRSTLQAQNEPIFDRVLTEQTEVEISPKSEVLKVLEENESHYKILIEIYEEHMKTCLSSSNFQRRQNINIVKQWKNLEKRNISLTHLVKQLPTFTKIYKQNLLLKQERIAKTEHFIGTSSRSINLPDKQENGNRERDEVKEYKEKQLKEVIQKVIRYYESLMSEMQQKFKQTLEALQKNFYELENEIKLKDKKIKDLKKRWEYPPDIEQLKNQNQYLNLNILNLENQIKKLQDSEQRIKLELKQSKKSTAKKNDKQETTSNQSDDIASIYDKLIEIKNEAEKESAQFDLERAQMQMVIHKLEAEINRYMAENNRIRNKYSKSKSKRKSHEKRPEESQSVTHSNTKKNLVQTPEQKQLFRSQIKYLTNSAVSMVSGQDDLHTQQQQFTKEILTLKMDNKRKHKEIIDLKKQLQQYVNGDRRIQDQFGKTLEQIIEEYREFGGRKMLQQSKSVKLIHRVEENKYIENQLKNLQKLRQSTKRQEGLLQKKSSYQALK